MTDPAGRLRRARRTVADLASEDGGFVVACSTTGHRPEPATGTRFDTRDDAQTAAEATRTYQAAMRELDPEHPTYRPTVYEDDDAPLHVATTRSRTTGMRSNGLPRTQESVTLSNGRDGEWIRMDDAPLIHLSRDDGPFEDDVVARQLDAKLSD
ncbi:DUF7552 domain-containing protein [Haloarchaeobius amylolyticus]|uniref:DUF7552 domain-containing protein n=1 Tax=Haloarchaeobius amylolyticus TaxID=1198296 RepID=UPI00226F4BD3|nr:hypothetical protein [Haloarchaeobius amylolyticus]